MKKENFIILRIERKHELPISMEHNVSRTKKKSLYNEVPISQNRKGCWRHTSVGKSICCSCRGSGDGPQQPHVSSQPSVAPGSVQASSPGLLKNCLHPVPMYVCKQITHTHKVNKNKSIVKTWRYLILIT